LILPTDARTVKAGVTTEICFTFPVLQMSLTFERPVVDLRPCR
jgi:hypothetical protein